MIGRFLFGALTGLLLVVSGMVLASALFPLPAPSGKVAEAAVANPEPVVTEPEPETATATTQDPVPEDTVEPEPAPTVAEAATEDVAATETTVEEAPASQPAVTEAAPVLPEASAEPASEAPSVAEVTVPAAPEAPATLPAPTEDPAVAPVEEPSVAPAAEPETELAEVTPEPTPEPMAEPVPEATPEPIPEALPETAPEANPEPATDPAAEPAPAAEPVPDPMPETEVAVIPEPIPEPVPEPTPEPIPEQEGAAGAEETADAGTASTFVPSPGFAPSGSIIEREEEAATAEAAEAMPAEAAADDTPITRFAASFDNPEGKPVLSIVLIDTGAADLDRAGLAALPFPVSFALDPMDPSTPDHAAIYRAAGREVVMLATGIAKGAQASDVEVAFQSMTQRLPEAVAVMDLSETLFQNDRPLASLVVPVVGGDGRGVLTWEKGLNAADQVARREDIPSAVIFRDLAMGGGDAAAAQRTLDRAVFKAGQDGRVVVAGAVTPELVAALLEWSVEGRAGAVALAPVTAVLQVD